MKKALYVVLLVVEFLLGLVALGYMAVFTTWTFLLLIFPIWAVLAIWILVKLKKAEDAVRRHKLKVRLALVTLIPLVAGIATFATFVIALSQHI